jgi:hypothetical protein
VSHVILVSSFMSARLRHALSHMNVIVYESGNNQFSVQQVHSNSVAAVLSLSTGLDTTSTNGRCERVILVYW